MTKMFLMKLTMEDIFYRKAMNGLISLLIIVVFATVVALLIIKEAKKVSLEREKVYVEEKRYSTELEKVSVEEKKYLAELEKVKKETFASFLVGLEKTSLLEDEEKKLILHEELGKNYHNVFKNSNLNTDVETSEVSSMNEAALGLAMMQNVEAEENKIETVTK